MHTAQISVLLQPFLEPPLPQSTLDQISIYIDLLLRWNARINLTAIRNEDEIVTRHFGESLFMARHLFPCIASPATDSMRPPQVIDIGSGAGFPALPLKLWAPHIHLTMIESNHKKATFLREATRALTLTNVNIIVDRAETTPDSLSSTADLVTLRAVEHFVAILPTAIKFLAPNGTLALLIGPTQLSHITTLTTLKSSPPLPVPQSHSRVLSISVKQRSG